MNHKPAVFSRRLFGKKLLVTVTAAVLGTSGLVACSNNDNAPAASGPISTHQVTGSDNVIQDVPDQPQRIVTLSEPTLDAVLALGLKPVGATAGRGQNDVASYIKATAGDIEIVGNVGQPNFEAIGALKPDLILVDGTSVNNNQPVIDSLRQIAPTVVTGLAGGDWKKNFTIVGGAVGKDTETVELIQKFDQRAATLKDKLAPQYGDKTFSVVRWQGNGASLILKELPAGRALTAVGLQRPPAQDKLGRGHSEPVSAENIAEIDADYMFFGSLGGSSVGNPTAGGSTDSSYAQQAYEEAKKVPGFAQLKCVQADHVYPVNGDVWTTTGGPLLMNRLLDDIEQALLGSN